MTTVPDPSEQGLERRRRGVSGVRVLQLISESRSWHFFNGQPEFLRANGIDLHAASSPGPLQDEFGRTNGGDRLRCAY